MSRLVSAMYIFALSVSAQEGRPILDGVYEKLQKVNDYQADITVKTDIPFINILPIGATIYFKQPDRIRLKSKGIAILPKQGFDQMLQLLRDRSAYNYLVQGKEVVGSVPATVVNVIPESDTGDIVLAKLWVDEERDLIIKAQITTKSSGTVLMEYVYGKFIEFGLCDQILFTIDVKRFKVPKALAADLNRPSDTDKEKQKNKKGTILIRFDRYLVNQGIDDAVFKKE